MPARASRRRTLANVYQALDQDHEIIPILNKVDLPAAEPARIREQIEEVIGLDASDAVEISAKTGLNIEAVLEAIVTRLPPPKGDRKAPLKAMLVDSWYDPYLGVVVLVRVMDGVLRKGMGIKMMGTDASLHDRQGRRVPPQEIRRRGARPPAKSASSPAAIKEVADTRVGDTITEEKRPCAQMLPGFKPVQPVVFLRPVPGRCRRSSTILRNAMGRLRLNDASFSFRDGKASAALGFRLSAAASSDCCIWRSCRSGSRANSIST